MTVDNFTEQEENGRILVRTLAFVIAVSLSVVFSVFFAVSGLAESRRDFELENRLNPNEAPIGSLVRLPGVGIGRASAIIAYRESFFGGALGEQAFEGCEDLQNVRGVGFKTAQGMCGWLKFE